MVGNGPCELNSEAAETDKFLSVQFSDQSKYFISCLGPTVVDVFPDAEEHRINNIPCMLGDWTAWTPCSVTCSRGKLVVEV